MAFNIRDLAISGRTIQSQVIQQSGGMTVRLQDKDVTENGNVIADAGYDGLSRVGVNVSGGTSSLEDNKTVSITQNGTVEITPSDTYDGMKKVTATVNVSGGSGQTYYVYGGFDGGTASADTSSVVIITKELLSVSGGTAQISYAYKSDYTDIITVDFKDIEYSFVMDESGCYLCTILFEDDGNSYSVGVEYDGENIVPVFTTN